MSYKVNLKQTKDTNELPENLKLLEENMEVVQDTVHWDKQYFLNGTQEEQKMYI